MMNTTQKKPSPWGKILLIGGNFIVFTVLIIQLALPNFLTKKLIHLPIERDLSLLSNSSKKRGRLPQQALAAYKNLNHLKKLPKNFNRAAPKARKKALNQWKKWWEENRRSIRVSGFNGLGFIAVLLCILGLMGLTQLEKISSPPIWRLSILTFFLNALAFFVLFTQYDKTSLGGFYAFSFTVSIFTLGYLARPEVQPATA